MANPHPLPAALAILRGNPGKRRIRKPPPAPPSSGACPDWLDEPARELWMALAPPLIRVGLLTATQEPALALLCEAWSEYRSLGDALRRDGRTQKGAHGEAQVPRPEVRMREDAFARLSRLITEFGLTPVAAMRLATPAKDAGSERKWAGLVK